MTGLEPAWLHLLFCCGPNGVFRFSSGGGLLAKLTGWAPPITALADQQPDQWDLAEDTWECDARRIYFYDLAEAPQSIVRKAMIKERDTQNGGHGWKW